MEFLLLFLAYTCFSAVMVIEAAKHQSESSRWYVNLHYIVNNYGFIAAVWSKEVQNVISSRLIIQNFVTVLNNWIRNHIYSVFVTQNHKHIRNTLPILLTKCCCRNMKKGKMLLLSNNLSSVVIIFSCYWTRFYSRNHFLSCDWLHTAYLPRTVSVLAIHFFSHGLNANTA